MKVPVILILTSILVFQSEPSASDHLLQLNINRPFNDVNENFISFAMKPEELYKGLDGPNRKTMTKMATMLSDSYIKFVGDYHFASKSDAKIRNPTRIVWKGFNRWTRAVNWTMIIPVPYTPETWDPMNTLKILNTSHLIGINDCIWQLGTNFGSARAHDYVTELNTLNLMVDSFRPYVEDWQIMGADISAGSSAEETRRYLDLTKDLNAAYGWAQPSESSGKIYSYNHDPALRVLLSQRVPVWLSLPSNSFSRDDYYEETTEGLRWAQTLGEAASTGFDAIFKTLTARDLEKPNFSFYITALFKKTMGSRVFPARSLNVFSRVNKLYTHCANSMSGGLAFMVVNTNSKTLQISVRSLNHLKNSEVWQYSLTTRKSTVLLNDEKLMLNSTLKPKILSRNTDAALQLNAPAKSVTFWVLPSVDLEHCQYTEVEALDNKHEDHDVEDKVVQKRYTSADKLLKKLIEETAISHSPVSKAINRRKRYATFANRVRRFILNEDSGHDLGKLWNPLALDDSALHKRSSEQGERRRAAVKWLTDLLDKTLNKDLPLLKRSARSPDHYFGNIFGSRDTNGKRSSFTRTITEIKKPEKKQAAPKFEMMDFDEEEFFKNMGQTEEPEKPRLPEGDVHIKHIANADGEEFISEQTEEQVERKKSKKKLRAKPKTEELESIAKPMRLLPSEFYEATLPRNVFKPARKMAAGGKFNSLFFPEPFSKKSKTNPPEDEEYKTTKNEEKSQYKSAEQMTRDFKQNQKELQKSYLKDMGEKDSEEKEAHSSEQDTFNPKQSKPTKPSKKYNKPFTFEAMDNYFGTDDEHKDEEEDLYFKEREKRQPSAKEYAPETTNESKEMNVDVPWWEMTLFRNKRQSALGQQATETNNDAPWWEMRMARFSRETPSAKDYQPHPMPSETPYWEMQLLRPKRALRFNLPRELEQNNMIDKNEVIMPMSSDISSNNLARFAYKIDDATKTENVDHKELTHKIATSLKEKLSKFVDIVSRHVSEWYSALAKHIHEPVVEITTMRS